jgi:hypothetical protein
MKDYLAQLVRESPSPVQARNVVREYLQARILGVLQHEGAMIPLAFHGGTALRFLYSSARYSEDLDFALEGKRERYDFRGYLRAIQAEFTVEGYEVSVRVSDQKTVNSAFVRFSSLLYELGLSPHRDEKLAVKLEVDTNPPAGARLTTTVVRRHVMLQFQHHDRASLLAGKLHAILQRRYVKGRDVYDLLWFLSDPTWPPPNLIMLNNALLQTGWSGALLTEETWRLAVRARLHGAEWEQVLADVRPFLAPGANLELLTRENLLYVIGSLGGGQLLG